MSRIVFVLAALLAPLAGMALDWAGTLGFSWSRNDQWLPTMHNRSPLLDLDLGLRLRHYVVSPEIVWVRAGANYRFLDRESNGITAERSNTYTYSALAAFFQRRGSPFTLTLQTDRIDSDLSGYQGESFGRRTANSGSASATLTLAQLPAVTAGYSWVDSTDHIPGLTDHTRTIRRLDSSLGHTSGAFNLTARYTGEWSDGNWLGEDYQSNAVGVEASAKLNDWTTFTLSDQYAQRSPTATFDAALAAEINTLQAMIRSTPGPQQEHVGSYTYNHSTLSTPATGSAAATGQTLAYALERRFDESEFSIRPTASLAMVEQTLGATNARTTGETLAALGRWHRKSGVNLMDVLAGPSVALLQDAAGDNFVGYGVSAAVIASRTIAETLAAANYQVSYNDNVGAVAGWVFRQDLSGSLQGPVGRGTVTGQLQFGAMRSWTPVFGSAASRNIYGSATYAQNRSQVKASLSIGSGIAGAPSSKFVGDGLLFTPFDSHSITAALLASTSTIDGLSASAAVHYGTTLVPGQPNIDQYGAYAALGYTFAAITLSLEDRVTTYVTASGRTTANQVSVRIFRAIGGGF